MATDDPRIPSADEFSTDNLIRVIAGRLRLGVEVSEIVRDFSKGIPPSTLWFCIEAAKILAK